MKKKLPQTSLLANQQATLKMRQDHWGSILATMRILNKPVSMQQIADHLKWELVKVSRRMSELQSDNLVFVDGLGKSKSGRSCQLYSLTKHGIEKDNKNAEDDWRQIQSEQPQTLFTQGNIF